MADSTVVIVHKKIAALIGVDFSSGFSGLNLSGAVVRGLVADPPYLPFACVSFTDARDEYGPTMGRYNTLAVFEVYAFAPGSDVATRGDAALNLVSDCIKAINADRSLGLSGLTDDVKCSYLAVDGDRFGVAGVGIGYIRVEVKFQSVDGV